MLEWLPGLILTYLLADAAGAALAGFAAALFPKLRRAGLGRMLASSEARFGFLIPAIAMAVGAASNWLKNRAQGKAQEEQAQLYNEWLKNRESGVNDIIEKLTASGNDPFASQKSTQEGTQSSTTTTSQRTSPFITPEYKKLEGQFRGILQNRLAGGSSLPAGYLGSAARGINDSFQGARVAAQNLAARRGLSGEQALSIAEPTEIARAGKIADVANQIPLLERQLQNEDINLASNLTGQFGRGQDMRGTSTTNSAFSSTALTPPNITALANLLLPPSPNAGKETGISQAGGVGGDIATSLLSLWNQGAFKPKPVGVTYDIYGNPTTNPSAGISG